ncbi:MAG: MFS transporter, partial [Candidatus Peregrinibacteria bacterium]|nr:MFS transporter [Candidatus Peregrinibacteria bacterium]
FINQSMLFYWGIYFTQINLGGFEQGIIFAIYPMVGILSVLPTGLFNDRVHSKNLIFAGFTLIAVQFFGILFTQNFFVLCGIFTLGSIGAMLSKLSIDSFFYKNSNRDKSKEVGTYVGTYLFGAGLGTLTGGFILNYVPFESLFIGVGIMALLMAFTSQLLPKNQVFHFELEAYQKDLLKPEILMFMLMIFLWAIHMGAEVSSYGLYLREDLGLEYQEMAIYMGSAIMGMYFWSKYASHRLSEKTPAIQIVYWGLFLSGAGLLVMTSNTLQLSYLGRLIHEGGDAFMFVFLYHGVRRLFPANRVGGSAGVTHFAQMSAITMSSLLFAPLGKIYGNAYPFIVGGIFILIALPIAYRFAHLIKH